jgi:hypothetical protein
MTGASTSSCIALLYTHGHDLLPAAHAQVAEPLGWRVRAEDGGSALRLPRLAGPLEAEGHAATQPVGAVLTCVELGSLDLQVGIVVDPD